MSMGFMGSVYLAGPIAGQTFEQANEWRIEATKLLSPLRAINPMRCKEYLRDQYIIDGEESPHPLGTGQGIITRDRNDLRRSDIVLMNLLPSQGTDLVSIGTMVELGWADAYRKPVVIVWERFKNPHRHMFINELAAYQAMNLEDGVDLCKMIIL